MAELAGKLRLEFISKRKSKQNLGKEAKMKEVLVTTLVILGLALVVAIVYCVDITKDRDALNTELKSVQSVLVSTQSELSSTKNTLLAELGSTRNTLTLTQSELILYCIQDDSDI